MCVRVSDSACRVTCCGRALAAVAAAAAVAVVTRRQRGCMVIQNANKLITPSYEVIPALVTSHQQQPCSNVNNTLAESSWREFLCSTHQVARLRQNAVRPFYCQAQAWSHPVQKHQYSASGSGSKTGKPSWCTPLFQTIEHRPNNLENL